MSEDFSRGVLYVVTTHKSFEFIEAAIESAFSVFEHMPEIGIHLYTDEHGVSRVNELHSSPFTSVGLIPEPNDRSKIDYLLKSPFEKTLYLDSDARVIRDILDIFDLLNRFDIGLAHAYVRNDQKALEFWNFDLPACFPPFDGGVILFNKSPNVKTFLHDWKRSFNTTDICADEVSLRELLWSSDLRFAILPPEYNVQFKKYLKIWEKEEASPKVLRMPKLHITPRGFLPKQKGKRSLCRSLLVKRNKNANPSG